MADYAIGMGQEHFRCWPLVLRDIDQADEQGVASRQGNHWWPMRSRRKATSGAQGLKDPHGEALQACSVPPSK